mmetsp:Transcript_34081/g.81957  ORF Transcript_34081/g.81957 Transcript_34081/m.81957 type:complete len:569 (+) Transcript_34081:488-2194(+)
MAWTYTQQVVLAVIPKIAAVLSCFGSSWIMIEVLTDNTDLRKPKRRHPYHRLLFAMSLYDVLEGIFNFMSTWMIPKGTEGVAWALGNTATCSTQGFFLTLSVAVPIYNAMLSIYYVLVINYRVKDETLKKWVEPCMHLTAGCWAFFTAMYSATTGLINNANLWCWIAPLPSDCLDSWRYGPDGNCVRGDNAWIYRWAFYFAPLWFCILVATVCTLMVYRYVRKLDKQTLKYRQPQRFSYLNTVMYSKQEVKNAVAETLPDPSDDGEGDNNSDVDDGCGDDETTKHSQEKAEAVTTTTDSATTTNTSALESQPHGENDTDNLEQNVANNSTADVGAGARTTVSDLGGSARSSTVRICTPSEEIGQCSSRDNDTRGKSNKSVQSNDGGNSDEDDDDRRVALASSILKPAKSVKNIVNNWQSSRTRYREDYRRTLEVFYQACFYLGAFYLTHIWSTSNRIMQMINLGSSSYGLTVMHAIFDPLQGFLNMFVYMRPRYLKMRKEYPEVGQLGAFYRMFRFSYLPNPRSWNENHMIYLRDHPSERRASSQPFRSSMQSRSRMASDQMNAAEHP